MKPNRWSCLPRAFSIVVGEVPYSTLIERIGHDGSEILFPELEEPLCRRGFNPQEIIDAYYDLDIYISEILYNPQQIYANKEIKSFLNEEQRKKRFNKYVEERVGVITGYYPSGKGHAFANVNGVVDPDTGKECVLPHNFRVESFFMRIK